MFNNNMNNPGMDDNDNILDFQKMNFQSFTTQFNAIPANAVNQFSAAKLVQNITTANGQVVGLVSGGDGGVQFLRPVDNGAQFAAQTQQNVATSLAQAQGYITLPITMPGAKPGDAQQTVHIQILNPNPPQMQQQPKFQMGQMQIPIQNFNHQDTTVLTVAYSPQEGEIVHNNLGEAMTIVAAIQPQDLPLLAQVQQQQQQAQQQQQQHQLQQHHHQQQQQIVHQSLLKNEDSGNELDTSGNCIVNIKSEPVWQNTVTTQTPDLSEYFTQIPQQQSMPVNLHQFLKFNPDVTIKNESVHMDENSTNSSSMDTSVNTELLTPEVSIKAETSTGTGKRKSKVAQATGEGGEKVAKERKKRKYTKKPPKPKKPKPGQVHIATALDGTALYCCPECSMAYPEKENLEQHLAVHKIERRFICDICGAGLKRKEHLERHKSGHNPDRPYTCSVCMKGFKRKEHLNLHFVIHSGVKNEICGACGKGFYRKDHLRKHANSHLAKRMKEVNAAASGPTEISSANTSTSSTISLNSSGDSDSLSIKEEKPQSPINAPKSTTICLPEVTIHVPTSDNQTLPVQIQLPQLVTTSAADGTTSTVVLSPQSTQNLLQQHAHQQSGSNTNETTLPLQIQLPQLVATSVANNTIYNTTNDQQQALQISIPHLISTNADGSRNVVLSSAGNLLHQQSQQQQQQQQ